MVAGQQLEREQRRAAAGRAVVLETTPEQLQLLAKPKLADCPVGDGALAVVGAAHGRLELVVPLRAQLRQLGLRALLRQAVSLRGGLGQRHETDCSERVAGPT